MRHICFATAIMIAASSASAQESADEGDGLSLMQRGAEMFKDGIMNEMGPALEDLGDLSERVGPALRNFAQEMGPALTELFEEIKDFSLYHPPVIMPNGDILIRRREEAPEYVPSPELEQNPDGSIDL